jgi:hypothetical protein
MRWPWRRFDRFFEAYSRRLAVEGLERRKLAIIGGLHSGNIGGEDLAKAVASIEESFAEAVAAIYGDTVEVDIDKDNPFFGKIKLPEIAERPTLATLEPELDPA